MTAPSAKPSDGYSDLRAFVAAHTGGLEKRVDGLEAGLEQLGRRFDRFGTALSDKLDTIGKAVALQGAQPHTKLGDVLDVIIKCAGLLTLAAGSIIFIATAISSAPLARMDEQLKFDRERIQRIERMLERTMERQVAGVPK